MVTGDNLLTALSVARECGIIQARKKAYLIEHDSERKDRKGRTLLTVREVILLENFAYSIFRPFQPTTSLFQFSKSL